MSEKKQYLIDEDTLKELLYASHKLEILERDFVDECDGYIIEQITEQEYEEAMRDGEWCV